MTIYAMDRRGRGANGDSADYQLDREIEDVVAVVEGIGTAVHLYGHSFGGACAAEAATRVSVLASLILYEGGPRPPGRFIPDDLILGLDSSIGEGHKEEALETFALSVAGVSPADLEVLKRSPAWPAQLAAAHTIPREVRAFNEYGTDMQKFQSFTVPTLLLFAGASLPRRRLRMECLAGLIPNSKAIELKGQGHAASQTAPNLLADAINAFVGGLQNGKNSPGGIPTRDLSLAGRAQGAL